MTGKDLPRSGYAVDGVFTVKQEQSQREPDPNPSRHGLVGFGWDWRRQGADVLEVLIACSIEAAPQRPEHLEVHVLGRFRVIDPAPAVPVEDLVRLQAVAILLPYARQALSTLTASSVNGPFYLPLIDVSKLMQDFDPNQATGAKAKPAKVVKAKRQARVKAR